MANIPPAGQGLSLAACSSKGGEGCMASFFSPDFHLSLEEALFQVPDGGEEMILVLTGAVRQSK